MFLKIERVAFYVFQKIKVYDFFEKRFATGICDLRGPLTCFMGHPIGTSDPAPQ